MAQTKYTTLTQFRKALDELLPEFDFEATEKMRKLSFATKTGKVCIQ